VTTNPLNASDPKIANHHWFPFLRYQKECELNGKNASVTDWLRKEGKLKMQDDYEASKTKAIEQKKIDDVAKAKLAAEAKAAKAAAAKTNEAETKKAE
tara:strand:+ start:318 stop:611 length:294 start_codon:yes stop_codon:yes gene_type:complete